MVATDKTDKMDKTGIRVVIAVAVALIVDGLDLQVLSLSLPSIMKEMKISPVLAGALSTYTLLGMGVGGIGAGWLADRIGRVRVTWWAITTFSVCTAIIGFCQEYYQIAIMRFISGFGIAAVYSIGSLLASEYVPTRIRTTILGTLQAGWSVGYVIAALLSSYILPNFGWRPLFVLAIVPGMVCLVMLRGVADPPSWFAARAAVRASGKSVNEYALIWKDKTIRRIFILWSITSIALQFGYYGANTWLPSYLVKDLGVNLKNMGWYLAATYTCMIVGKMITGYLGDIFGRKAMWVFAGVATAIALPTIMFFATPASVAYLLLIFGLLYGAPYAINATYMSESFPTHLRGTAMATSYNIGRLGSTISPLLIGWAASNYSITLGIALLGISYAITALV
ncbi:MAG: MFS transporter, partial [Syntrophales bacterium]|nr:MFS transporter [Syntrophales bacterium]